MSVAKFGPFEGILAINDLLYKWTRFKERISFLTLGKRKGLLKSLFSRF